MPLCYFHRPLFLLLCAFAALLTALRAAGWFAVRPPPRLRPFANLPWVQAEGTVASGFNPKRPGVRYWLTVDRVQHVVDGPVRVLAYLDPRLPAVPRLRPGQRVLVEGRLRLPRWPRNPGEFDEEDFLEDGGAAFVLHGRKLSILDRPVPLLWKPWSWGEAFHRSIQDYLGKRFSGEGGIVLQGVILGTMDPLAMEWRRIFQTAGVMHMLTPSGDKVTLVMGWTFLAGSCLGVPVLARMLAAAAAGGFFLLVVGTEPSYTRAWMMALGVFWAWERGRVSGGFQAWTLAALATLALDPRSLFAAGFQLTYLAMFGLLMVLPSWVPPISWPAPLRLAAQLAGVGVVVQMMVWPAFANYFGCSSLVGFLVNMLLVPASHLMMGVGLAAWACATGSAGLLERPLAWAAGGLAELFAALCRRAACLPWAAVTLRAMTPAEIAAYYLAAFGVLTLPRRRTAAVFLAAGACLWAGGWLWGRWGPQRVRVLCLSAPKASAALVTLPGERHILIDAGVAPAALRDIFRFLGVRRLESVWITGPDPSRWKGVAGLPRFASVGEIRVAGGDSPDRRWPRALAALRAEGIPLRRLADPAPGGEGAVLLRHGRVLFSWSAGGLTVRDGRGGAYCIMRFPSGTAPGECPASRSFALVREGAVQVVSNGKTISITTQRERRAHGPPVL